MNHESLSKTMLLYTFLLHGWNSSLYQSTSTEWGMHEAVTYRSMLLEQTNKSETSVTHRGPKMCCSKTANGLHYLSFVFIISFLNNCNNSVICTSSS